MKAGLGWGLTLLNIGVALISVLCLGYFWGYEHGQQSARPQEGIAGYSNAVAPNTSVGAGQHPTFECRTMTSEVQVGSSELSVDKVAGSRKDLSGSSIRVKGKVVSAFKNIMGLNCLHLCSRPNGPVLVAASPNGLTKGKRLLSRASSRWSEILAARMSFLYSSKMQRSSEKALPASIAMVPSLVGVERRGVARLQSEKANRWLQAGPQSRLGLRPGTREGVAHWV